MDLDKSICNRFLIYLTTYFGSLHTLLWSPHYMVVFDHFRTSGLFVYISKFGPNSYQWLLYQFVLQLTL